MSLLVETIRVENGILLNIYFHNERMKRSLFEVFRLHCEPNLEKIIVIPPTAFKGILKCRIEYDETIRKIEFLPYIIKQIRTLRLVEDDNISYSHKFTNRDDIQRLMEKRGDCDDILIIKKGMVTDSSYANVIFRELNGNWVTPSTYLLAGTRRAVLLQQGLITEERIGYNDLVRFSEAKLINAMTGIDDTEGIPAINIK